MRPLPFAILAVLALVLQISLAPAIEAPPRTLPQLPLILAVYVALFAKADAALIACWSLGLLMDLASIGPMGGCAVAYGLAGAGIVYIRSSVFRDHPLSHVFLTLVFCFLANEIIALRVAINHGVGFHRSLLLFDPLASAIYTALLAPCLMPLLNTTRRVMQFPEKNTG